jgi:hypothetical protein
MQIKLSKPFALDRVMEEDDVRLMKKALNRLGYYIPYDKVGITGMADVGVFDALKAFQKDHGLAVTGEARPGDETEEAINREAAKTPEGKYIWRTVDDDKVRAAHALFNGTVRDWADEPDPGEDYNCRCWAERVKTTAVGLRQQLISDVKDSPKWTSLRFLQHFFFGGGSEVTLESSGYLSDIIAKAEKVLYRRLESQISDKMRSIKDGVLIYRTENSYPELKEVKWVFGIASIRQLFIGPHNLSDLSPDWCTALGVTISEIAFGRMYQITGSWRTRLSGTINLR